MSHVRLKPSHPARLGGALAASMSLLGCVAAPVPSAELGEDAGVELAQNTESLLALTGVTPTASADTSAQRTALTTSFSDAIIARPGPQCVYTGAPPAALSKQVHKIRILSQNTFGKDEDGNVDCIARAKALGNIIANASPAYDIVGLQEHWNSWDAGIVDCGATELSEAIWSTGRYRNSNNYYRHRPEGEWSQLDTDGGLSIFSMHPIEQFVENEWDDIPGVFNGMHGSTFSRIRLPGSGIAVDYYNAHLLAAGDDCDAACRREEIQELREEILLYSRNSGNPVIVAGDFNIGGPPACAGNDRFADIMELLENPRDLWLEAHPGEDGFTMDCVENTVLQEVEGCSSRERIDFMFVVTSPNLQSSNYEVVVREPSDMRVAKFTRADGRHISDHFGLEATLEIRQRGRVSTPFVGLANKCMDVAGGQTAEGTPVQLFTCNSTASQRWTLDHFGQLRGLGGKCLTVRGSSTANGTPTEMRTCTGAANQRFDYTAQGELRSRLSSTKCIEVRGGFTTDRTPIQVYNCNGTASQLWRDYATPNCVAPKYVCGASCCTPEPEPSCYEACLDSCNEDGSMLPRQCVQLCRAECAP